MRGSVGAWALVAACGLGCSQRATITRVDGRVVDGVIVGGDARHVRVDPVANRPDAEPLHVIEIPRERIAEIEHPGVGGMVSGGLGYAVRLPLGEPGGAGPDRAQHGFVYDVSVSHVVRVVHGVDMELGHGFGWVAFGDPSSLGPEGGWLGFGQFDVVVARLGVRVAL